VALIRFRSDPSGLLTAKRFAALGQPFPHVDAGPTGRIGEEKNVGTAALERYG
jgi:hypothetical protein